MTGAAGFIGRRLVGRLLALGAAVVAADRVEPRQAGGASWLVGDLLDCAHTHRAMAALQAPRGRRRAVFHLAGQSSRAQAVADPDGALAQNVVATQRVLECCRAAGVSRVLFPSTALVYRERGPGPITEDDPVGPASIYEATKLCAEALVAGYGGAFGFSADVARVSAAYGPGCRPDTVVGSAVAQARARRSVALRSLAPVRDFVFVDDVVDTLVGLLCAGHEPGARIFNVCSGVATSVGEMAAELCRIAGLGPPAETGIPGGCAGPLRIELSPRRLEARTGLGPWTSLSEGLARTLEEQV
ncbi:MAG: NAD(P)-dependent oxidoreductase [Deltaproteobacteria bacterium]|nr:NAD(P)-dependent oxidoreductase [Deltaproteobacteria bacterium]